MHVGQGGLRLADVINIGNIWMRPIRRSYPFFRAKSVMHTLLHVDMLHYYNCIGTVFSVVHSKVFFYLTLFDK